MKKYLVVLVVVIVVIGIWSRAQKKPDELIVGMFVWAPFMSINPSGEYVGFDVDVARLVAKRMNKKLVIKDLGSLASCFIALEQNKIDLLFSGLDITTERLSKLNMVPYTGEEMRSLELLFWKTIPPSIKSMNDLDGMTVSAEPGSTSDKFMNLFPRINKKPLANTTDMVLDLRYGKSTAMILEPAIARRLQRLEPSLVLLEVPIPEELRVYGMGIASKKSNAKLASDVEKVVFELKAEGEIKRLEQQWRL